MDRVFSIIDFQRPGLFIGSVATGVSKLPILLGGQQVFVDPVSSYQDRVFCKSTAHWWYQTPEYLPAGKDRGRRPPDYVAQDSIPSTPLLTERSNAPDFRGEGFDSRPFSSCHPDPGPTPP